MLTLLDIGNFSSISETFASKLQAKYFLTTTWTVVLLSNIQPHTCVWPFAEGLNKVTYSKRRRE